MPRELESLVIQVGLLRNSMGPVTFLFSHFRCNLYILSFFLYSLKANQVYANHGKTGVMLPHRVGVRMKVDHCIYQFLAKFLTYEEPDRY